MKKIHFNIPQKIKNINYFNNLEIFAGNGEWTKKLQKLLIKKYSFKKVLLTDSCTSALEIAALSLKLKKNDDNYSNLHLSYYGVSIHEMWI